MKQFLNIGLMGVQKMAKNSIDAYGASGKTNVLMFEPEKLHWSPIRRTHFTMSVYTCRSRKGWY